MSSPRSAAAAAALFISLMGLTLAAAPTPAEALACQGRPATVAGPVGPEGDAVKVAPLDSWTTVEGLGGDDLICLVDGTARGGRDPLFFADAGTGDDVVDYQATYSATVTLGVGNDRFVGNDVGNRIYTGASAPIPGGVGYFGQVDRDPDEVIGSRESDAVYSGDTGGYVANDDRISTSGGSDNVFYAGAMTEAGALDNGTGSDRVFLVSTWPTGTLDVDHTAHVATLAGATVLRWTRVRDFVIDERPGALRFRGGPGGDQIRVGDVELPTPGPVMPVEVVTGRGRDRVELAGRIDGSVRLGTGSDALALGGGCRRTTVHLRGAQVCTWTDGRSRTRLAGIEDLYLRGRDVLAVGTRAADRISVLAHQVRALGKSGDDVLSAPRHHRVLVDGGNGTDRCFGQVLRRCELP
ncbi:MAG: hypothetical protein LH477_15265 [Nocardioides sp.]|nr:hypothetical protein [Nocardioides sp.]